MSTRRSNAPSRLNWEMVKCDVVNTPGMTLADAAEKYDVTYETMRIHGGPRSGNWLAVQKRNTEELARKTDSRMSEILAQDRADDVHAFLKLENRLQKVVLSGLELLFPPLDAPVEAKIAARKRLEEMSGKQLSTLICEGMRTLAETGRHRRLLTGQATALFARAEAPDIMIPIPIEEARALEMRSRMAQTALLAIDGGIPLDVDFGQVDSRTVEVSPGRSIPPDFLDG